MTVHIVWICDGCSERKIVNDGKEECRGGAKAGDWKQITVEISGFKGYPVPEDVNGPRHYELCPDCQRQVSSTFFPRLWPRPVRSKKDEP